MTHPDDHPPAAPEATVPPPGGQVTRLAVTFELGIGVTAGVLAWLVGYPLWATLRPTVAGSAVGALATFPLLAALWGLLRSGWPALRRLVAHLERDVLPLFAGCTPLQLLAIATAAGVGEELLFRGLIQGGLSQVAGPMVGLLVASTLFGLAHAITGTYAALAAAVGLYLGALAIATGGIWVPIVVHALYDLVALGMWTHARGAAWRSLGNPRPRAPPTRRAADTGSDETAQQDREG